VTAQAAETLPGTDSPYVGLTFFTEEYSDVFFGRDAERSVIIGNLCAARLTLLYAESGVGKSSLLRAGVASALRRQARIDLTEGRRPRFIPVIFSSWTGDPVSGIIDAVRDAVAPFSDFDVPGTSLGAALEAAAAHVGATLLVILDQFEEYFLYHSSQDGHNSHPFADDLARCILRPDLRANFLISIREDRYSELGDLFRGRIPNVYGNFLRLEYLNRQEGRSAITGPVETLKRSWPQLDIEPELVSAVLDGVRLRAPLGSGTSNGDDGMRVETTYLQLVMRRLWQEEEANDSAVLRLETLERLGGAQEIIESHLNRAMSELPPGDRDIAAAAFRYLVTRSGAKIALSPKDLSDVSNLPEEDLERVLQRLASGEVKILRPVVTPDVESSARYEIFHDALARPILRWREDYRVERERIAKDEAQRRAAEAEHSEAIQRKRKRIALGALGAAIAALVLSAIATAAIIQRKNTLHVRTLQSIEASERLRELGLSPSFGESSAALAAIEAERHLKSTFEARNGILGLLQVNVALPKVGFGHSRSALATAFVTNNVIASGSADGSVRLWGRNGQEIGKPLLTGRVSTVAGIAMNAQRGLLVAARGYPADEIDLWNIHNLSAPRLVKRLRAGSAQNAVALSPLGAILAAGGNGKIVRVWDIRNLRHPRLLARRADLGATRGLAFNDNGVLGSASDGGLSIWADFGIGKSTPLPSKSGTTAIAIAPALWVAVALGDAAAPGVELIGLGPNAGKDFVIPTSDLIQSLAFADRGRVLVGGGQDLNVTTWDVASRRVFGPPRMTEGANVNAVAVSPSGKSIAWADDNGRVDLSPLRVRAPLATTVGAVAPADLPPLSRRTLPRVHDLALLPGGRIAAAAGPAGTLIWSLRRGNRAPRPLAHIPAPDGSGTFALTAKGNLLAVATGSGFTLYGTSRACPSPCQLGSLPQAAPAPTTGGGGGSGSAQAGSLASTGTGAIESLAFDPTRNVVFSADEEGDVSAWNVANPHSVRFLSQVGHEKKPVIVIAVNAQGDRLAAGGQDGTVRLWDISDPRHARPVGAPVIGHQGFAVASLAFSPDGRRLASGGEDQQVVLWDVDPTRGLVQPRPTQSQTNTILALAFSPDGGTLAAADGDGSICLYDAASGRYIGNTTCLLGHYSTISDRTGIEALRFTSDGKSLISAGDGNPVVAWNSLLWDESKSGLDPLTTDVCRIAERNLTLREWNAVFTGTPLAGKLRKTCTRLP
jgi:WD40 repeat protein